jgi:hypothetical protein
MEIERDELEVIMKRRCVILDKATFLEKGICIPNHEQFMWIKTKHNYNRHVERMENWNDIDEEEEWASKVSLVDLFLLSWEAPMPDVMLEFFNTFVIKCTNIYFGHKDNVYVISKQLVIDVFGVCAKGYVDDPKG